MIIALFESTGSHTRERQCFPMGIFDGSSEPEESTEEALDALEDALEDVGIDIEIDGD
ncbi:hypothetical protein GCM10009780_44040 [Actinomadura alba]